MHLIMKKMQSPKSSEGHANPKMYDAFKEPGSIPILPLALLLRVHGDFFDDHIENHRQYLYFSNKGTS